MDRVEQKDSCCKPGPGETKSAADPPDQKRVQQMEQYIDEVVAEWLRPQRRASTQKLVNTRG